MRTYETNFRDDSFYNYIIGTYTNYIGNNYVSIDSKKHIQQILINNQKIKIYKKENIGLIIHKDNLIEEIILNLKLLLLNKMILLILLILKILNFLK